VAAMVTANKAAKTEFANSPPRCSHCIKYGRQVFRPSQGIADCLNLRGIPTPQRQDVVFVQRSQRS
jgi:hypothetical protein